MPGPSKRKQPPPSKSLPLKESSDSDFSPDSGDDPTFVPVEGDDTDFADEDYNDHDNNNCTSKKNINEAPALQLEAKRCTSCNIMKKKLLLTQENKLLKEKVFKEEVKLVKCDVKKALYFERAAGCSTLPRKGLLQIPISNACCKYSHVL